MRLGVHLKRAAACIAAILPIVAIALAVGMSKHHPHRAPGPGTNAGPQFMHRGLPEHQGHFVGWVNHFVGPFTAIAANL